MRATRGSRPHVGACCLCPSTSEVFTVCAVLVVGRDGPDADRGPPPPHGARDATPIYAGHRHRHTRCREIQSAYTASAIGVTAAGGAPRAARETRRVGGGGPELSRIPDQLAHCSETGDTQHTRKEPSNGRLFIHSSRRFRQPVGGERAIARVQRRAVRLANGTFELEQPRHTSCQRFHEHRRRGGSDDGRCTHNLSHEHREQPR
jgi:hypothetical protein